MNIYIDEVHDMSDRKPETKIQESSKYIPEISKKQGETLGKMPPRNMRVNFSQKVSSPVIASSNTRITGRIFGITGKLDPSALQIPALLKSMV